jgi:hypothetical protein
VDAPSADADSTVVWASKDPAGVAAGITLCRAFRRKSGEPIGAGRAFTLADDAKVRALVRLRGLPEDGGRALMFHVVWLGPGNDEIYTKRVDLVPEGTEGELRSAISIPPHRRDPGIYALRVYLFRELIAEKRFELLPGEPPST